MQLPAFALCVALSTLLAAGAQSLDTLGAGSAAADSVRSAGDAAAGEALARFDRWIEEHPEDAAAAAERCRFLSLVGYDGDGEAIRFEAEAGACDSELEERHGNALPARAYLIEREWGEEVFEKAEEFLVSEAEGTAYELPVLRHLVAVGGRDDESTRLLAYYARRAMLLDPSLDLNLPLARGLLANGDAPGAIAALTGSADAVREPWLSLEKATLLHEMGAHEPSVEQFQRAIEDGATPYNRLPYARSLQALGRIDEAREQFRLQPDQGYGQWKRDAQRELLALEMEHGDATNAAAAYQGLRDEGFGADPFARHRIRLWIAHPSAPWRIRDLLGLAAVAGALLAATLVPLLLLLPVHYAGLLRSRKNPGAAPVSTWFSLRRAWLALAVLIIGQLLALYLFPIDEILDLWSEEPTAASKSSPGLLARFGTTATLCTGVVAVLAGRSELSKLYGRGNWGWGRTIGAALGCLVLLRIVAGALQLVSAGTGQQLILPQVIRSVASEFGIVPMLLLVAVITPIAEEVLFRGVVLSGLMRHIPFGWSNALQAASFMVLHEGAIQLPFIFALGLVSGLLTRRSGSLRAATLLHAANNALACAALLRLSTPSA